MLNNMLDLLRSDGSIVVNKKLAKMIGLDEAIIYSELASQFNFWSMKDMTANETGKIVQGGEWFFCTVEKMEEHTTIKKGRQDRAIQQLKKLGLVETKRLGLPSKRYFKMTNEIFTLMFGAQLVQNERTDNSNVSAPENAEKARSNQIAQNEPSRESKMSDPDSPKWDTINNRSSNNRFSNNDLKKEEEEAAAILLSEFQKNISPTAGDSIKAEFTKWLTILPFDIIANELQYAIKRNATSFSYIEKALLQDQQQGVDSIEKLENKRAQYAASKKKPVNAQKRPVREEKVPAWLKDNRKEQNPVKELTEGEKESLELEKAQMLEKLALRKQKN